MIDQSNIVARIVAEDDGYYLFIRDEFIRSYKTLPAAKGQMTKRLLKLFSDEHKKYYSLQTIEGGAK